MGDTEIGWTHRPGTRGRSWNPTQGCALKSEGCRNCYAMRMAARFAESGWSRGLINLKTGKWNGSARLAIHKLREPLGWREPSTVFTNSMSDLFYEGFTNEEIAAVFGVMAATPRHTYLILTKRPDRMRAWFEVPGIADLVEMFRQIVLAGRIEEYFAPERILDLEEWPGYAVTSKGRIISNRKGADHEMKVQHGEQGHGRVQLYHSDGYDERVLVHRLVLAAFDRMAVDEEQGCHINGDATNNALWNLRWGTQSANWDDSKRHGTRRRYSKLTEDQVAELRRLAADGVSGAELGRRFCISDTQARNIATGKQWTPEHKPEWPLRSVWLGVSVENQDALIERWPDLFGCPAVVHFFSAEPLLSALDFTACFASRQARRLWLIDGCESGPGARPAKREWFRDIEGQCHVAGIPYFHKQQVIDGRLVHDFPGRQEFPA